MTTLLIIIFALLLALFLVCGFIFNQLVWAKQLPIPKFILNMIAGNGEWSQFDEDHKKAFEKFEKMPLQKIELRAPDGATLRGHLLVPPKSNGRIIIACHGAHSSGLGEFAFPAPYFYENGYTLLMPDHRGCGISDGKFMGYGTHESRDAFLWVDYAEKRFPDLSIFLLGVSMGGATVLMMSDKESRIKGVIADCPYTSAWDEFSYQIHTSFHLPDFPVLHICDLYSRVFCRYSFKQASPLEAVKNAKKPILFIHGKADDFVPFFMQNTLYEACPTEKYKLSVENAVHARSYYTSPEIYENAIESFMNKYDNT